MLNKSFLWFSASLFCAVIAFSYVFFLYLNWDDVPEREEGASSVEVTLPVINWGKYEDLSKQDN